MRENEVSFTDEFHSFGEARNQSRVFLSNRIYEGRERNQAYVLAVVINLFIFFFLDQQESICSDSFDRNNVNGKYMVRSIQFWENHV